MPPNSTSAPFVSTPRPGESKRWWWAQTLVVSSLLLSISHDAGQFSRSYCAVRPPLPCRMGRHLQVSVCRWTSRGPVSGHHHHTQG